MIYFIQGEITRRIKIGYTACEIFEDRFQPMKSSSPDQLRFIGGMIGDRRREKEIHNLFYGCHSHGEWFDESQELYDFIEENCHKTINMVEVLLPEIASGRLTISEALTMTEDDVSIIQRDRISKAYKNLWKGITFPDVLRKT
jgi:hypothetical protein